MMSDQLVELDGMSTGLSDALGTGSNESIALLTNSKLDHTNAQLTRTNEKLVLTNFAATANQFGAGLCAKPFRTDV